MFHHIRSCDKTGNVDMLFGMYEEYRNNIYKMLIENPNIFIEKVWTYDSPITIDRNCKCEMGHGIKSTDFTCSHCYNIKRMTKFNKEIVDIPFIIEYGKKTGERIIIIKYNISELYLREDNLPLVKSKSLSKNFKICSPTFAEIKRCIIGDSFTINTILSIFFQKYFGEDNQFVSSIYSSFVCNNNGYCIYKVPNIGTISSLFLKQEYFLVKEDRKIMLPNVIRGIIVQLYVILTELRNFNFSHGTPGVSSLLFSDKQVTGSYNEVNIDSPVTIQFSNLTKASATIEGIHYFSKSMIDDINLENFVFTPNLDCSEGCKVRKFKVNSSNPTMQNTLNSLGFPIYIGTYDFYMFMLSLMSYSEIFHSVSGDKSLSELWSSMWGSSLEKVDEELQNHVNIKEILRDKWLKCDVLSEVPKFLK